MKQNFDGNESGIIEMQCVLNKIECCDIGNRRVWIRKCPECNDKIVSQDKWYCEDANKQRRLCKKCRIKGNRNPNYGKCVSEDRKQKWKATYLKNDHLLYWTGKSLSESHKYNISISKRGTTLSPEHIECIRRANKGNFHRKGILHDKNSKIKMRIAKAKYAMRNAGIKICPAFNETACKYFEWLNKWNGWSGKYATNGGEYFLNTLGYWVDYYEPKENVVIEWDEKRHYRNGNLTDKDVYRMQEIKELLGCRFYRIDARTRELKEY